MAPIQAHSRRLRNEFRTPGEPNIVTPMVAAYRNLDTASVRYPGPRANSMKWTKIYVSAKHLGQQIVETACEFFEVKENLNMRTRSRRSLKSCMQFPIRTRRTWGDRVRIAAPAARIRNINRCLLGRRFSANCLAERAALRGCPSIGVRAGWSLIGPQATGFEGDLPLPYVN